MMISDRPEATASSTTYWIVGLSTRGSISLGWALVAGRNRVPSPAAGKTALRTLIGKLLFGYPDRGPVIPVKRLFDAAPQVTLGRLAPFRRDPCRDTKQCVCTAPPNDTLGVRPIERTRGLPPPAGAAPGPHRQCPRHRHFARHRHVHDCPRAAEAVVGKLRELAVGDDAQRPVVHAHGGHPQPGGFHRPGVAANLHDV